MTQKTRPVGDAAAILCGVGGGGDPGFFAEDLLRAQGEGGGLLGREGERFIVAVGVQRLRAAEDGREGLIGDADDVVQRLLRGEGDAAGLRVEA
jgi:hypothetical protein